MGTLQVYMHYLSAVTVIWIAGIAGGVLWFILWEHKIKTGFLVVAMSLFVLATDLLAVAGRTEFPGYDDGFRERAKDVETGAYILILICIMLGIADWIQRYRDRKKTPVTGWRARLLGRKNGSKAKGSGQATGGSPQTSAPPGPSTGSTPSSTSTSAPAPGRRRATP